MTPSLGAPYTAAMQGIWLILDSLIAVLALVLGFILHKWISDRKVGDASNRAERIIQDAERDAASREMMQRASHWFGLSNV